MIIKIEKGDYNVVKSDEGKLIRIKGERMIFPNATELKAEPKEYEEIEI